MILSFKQLSPEMGIPFTRVHLYRLCEAGQFPRPIQISLHRIGWVKAEIEAWLEERARKREVR